MLEVFAEGFNGIEIVFAEGECARGGGRPGIDQRHLHYVVSLAGVAHERSAVGNVDVDLGPLIKVIGVVRVAAAHNRVGDNGIDFDSGYAGAAVCQRAQDVYTAARADNGVLPLRAQDIRQRRRRRHQAVLPQPAPVFGIDIHEVG